MKVKDFLELLRNTNPESDVTFYCEDSETFYDCDNFSIDGYGDVVLYEEKNN